MRVSFLNSFRIDGTSTNNTKDTPYMDVQDVLSGYAPSIRFNPEWHGCFVIARKSDEKNGHLYFVMLPSKEWRQDLVDMGFEILQTVTNKHLLLDDKPAQQDSEKELRKVL